MKKIFLISLIMLISSSQAIVANTPREALEITVNKLIAIAADKSIDEQTKKTDLTTIISSEVDFDAVSKRIISKPWKMASEEQQKQFKQQFLIVMVNTYFTLLKEYSDEKVLFVDEQLKNENYAIVDTELVSGNKKIPVRYRLLKNNEQWKIYDFIPEGISLVSTYRTNYASILENDGIDALLAEMRKTETEKPKE